MTGRWPVAAACLTAAALLLAPAPALGQWPAGTGQGWVKLTAMAHRTTTRFDAAGDERDFFADGESTSRALFLDALVGVHPYVDLWLQLPWFDLSYDDAAGKRDASGFGDVRAYTRWSVGHHLLGGIPLSVRLGAKAPVQDFPLDAEVIPVGEGQWDVELWLEGGHSFHPFPAYASAWVGYRWRFENETARRDPGDERLFLVDVGLTAEPVGAKVVVEGLFGDNPVIQGIRVGQGARQVVVVQPEILLRVTPSVLAELGMRQPLHGQSWPAGRQWVAGVFVRSGG